VCEIFFSRLSSSSDQQGGKDLISEKYISLVFFCKYKPNNLFNNNDATRGAAALLSVVV